MMIRVLNDIKSLSIDMINEANSGHPGIALGAANILYTLYKNHLNINVNDEKWINRDRFVMSAGHGSALLYATLFMTGYEISIDDLKNFRRINSLTPGHPEYGVTPGVDMTTGPLGQGFASAVGMALGEKILEAKSNETGKNIFDYKVYVLCGDGDLMEGISNEAASLAGTLKLNNLIVLYDSNDVCLDGRTSKVFKENVLNRFKALGWHTIKTNNKMTNLNMAINKAKKSSLPTIIEVKTKIGEGSLLQDTNKVHGAPLTKEDIEQLKRKLECFVEPFTYNKEEQKNFQKHINDRTSKKYQKWLSEYKNSKFKDNLRFLFEDDYYDLEEIELNDINEEESTRVSNGKIMNKISKKYANFIGGSADVASSTKTYIEDEKDISANNFNGKNIWFGVREHAMGAILNGLALTGFKPYGSAFLTFSDYVKPAIRMSSLISLPVTYIFTHDAINIGQDGPTHQPIEQLAMLRSIPNLNVFRPCDANEVLGCWEYILNSNTPSALILSRNNIKQLSTSSKDKVKYGAYIVRKEDKLDAIIIATGSEVALANQIASDIYDEYKIDIRVVSMPSQELFNLTSKDYQDAVLPKNVKTFVIEPSSSMSWYKYVSDINNLLTIDSFGKSGTTSEVLKEFEFDLRSLKEKILKGVK